MIFQAVNEYQLHSSWSSPLLVTIQNISVNSSWSKDLLIIEGVTDSITYHTDEHFGTFTNSSTGRSSDVRWDGQGTYTIDDDMDGK